MDAKIQFRWTAASIAAFLVCSLFVSLAAQEQDQIDLFVDDGRPVAKAIDELASRLDYPITYEDPQYRYSEDVRDVTTEVSRSSNRNGHRVLVPAGGTLELRTLRVPHEKGEASARMVLQQLIEAEASRANGIKFRLATAGNMIHVLPAAIRNKDGEWTEQTSVLSARISIPRAERTTLEMINAICSAISAATGQTIGLASGPVNTLSRQKAMMGADAEVARDVLIRTLRSTDAPLTWKILYSPDLGWFALNITAGRTSSSTSRAPTPQLPPSSGRPPSVPLR